MFVNECTQCHKRQLIFPSQLTSAKYAGAGTALGYTCWCGAEQTWVTTDRTPLAV